MSDNFRSRSKCDGFEFDALTENVLTLVRGEKLYFALQTYIKSQEEILTMNWTVFLSYVSDTIRTSWIDAQPSENFSLLLLQPKILYVSICQTQIKILGCERLTSIQSVFKNWYLGEYCLKGCLKLYFWRMFQSYLQWRPVSSSYFL